MPHRLREIIVFPTAMNAWRHHVSRGRAMHIKIFLRQTFANDVTIGDHADQPVILSNRDSAYVVRAHQFGEFGDRGIRADPLDALVHCFLYFHADLHTRAWVNGFSRQVSDLPTVKSSWTGGPIVAEAKCPLWIKSRHMECKTSCPLYPRKRTCALQLGMSDMGQKRTFIGPFR